ncbi:hypothetical protein [Pseudonocardia acaciae]|uniref:hypothetical protein n=1 Tax=Pseudonocardia acaciae TaxID=551276 RepID=UPI000687E948|nr:hypothetical protein [Pseudonocardia acaciae]
MIDTRKAVVAALLAVSLAGCGGATGRGGSDQPGVPAPDVSASKKESISTSSVQDIAAALRANQVENPEKWARIIVEYRPYPGGDPGLGKLRQALVQHRAEPRTIDQIMTVLQP